METKLVKRFFLTFWIGAITCTIIITGFTVGTIISWVKYSQGDNKLFIPILSAVLLLMFIVLSIIWLKPSVRDLPAVKKRNFEKITGAIIRYKTVIHGGESPTRSYHPIVRDSLTGNEVELIVINRNEKDVRNPITKKWEVAPEFYGTYTFIYLKHTKLAVIKEAE